MKNLSRLTEQKILGLRDRLPLKDDYLEGHITDLLFLHYYAERRSLQLQGRITKTSLKSLALVVPGEEHDSAELPTDPYDLYVVCNVLRLLGQVEDAQKEDNELQKAALAKFQQLTTELEELLGLQSAPSTESAQPKQRGRRKAEQPAKTGKRGRPKKKVGDENAYQHYLKKAQDKIAEVLPLNVGFEVDSERREVRYYVDGASDPRIFPIDQAGYRSLSATIGQLKRRHKAEHPD